MAKLVAERGCPAVIMHNRETVDPALEDPAHAGVQAGHAEQVDGAVLEAPRVLVEVRLLRRAYAGPARACVPDLSNEEVDANCLIKL